MQLRAPPPLLQPLPPIAAALATSRPSSRSPTFLRKSAKIPRSTYYFSDSDSEMSFKDRGSPILLESGLKSFLGHPGHNYPLLNGECLPHALRPLTPINVAGTRRPREDHVEMRLETFLSTL